VTTLTLAAACAVGGAVVKPGGAEVPALAEADNRFGFRLFAELTAGEPGKNVFVSPASIAIALQMTQNGAAGETRAAMARALELSGLTPDAVNAAAQALQQSLVGADPKVRLQIANSLWAHKAFRFKKTFADLNKRFFGARVTTLDFAAPSAVSTINGWVSQNTNGLIREIVTQLNPDDILLLINAIYFKGTWQEQFDKNSTSDQDFHLEDGGTLTVKMMHQDGNYSYMEEAGFQAVRLPYGNGRLAMYVFLPSPESNLDAFMARLTADEWNRMLGMFGNREGDIALPRFKLEYSKSLADVLKAMGMDLAFSPGQADFTGMGGQPGEVYIGDVLHKTFVEVNEEGTEAAAVTAVKMLATAMPQRQDRFSMVVDRPFFCAIQDSETGTVLFMGGIREPK
jgi:serpin B